MTDRVSPPVFVDDSREPVGKVKLSYVIAGSMAGVIGLWAFINWATAEDTAPPKKDTKLSLAATNQAPLRGLPTDYTQIPLPKEDPLPVAPPPVEKTKAEPPKPAPAPRPVVQQPAPQGQGGGKKSWRQEAQEADSKVITVTQAGGGGQQQPGGGEPSAATGGAGSSGAAAAAGGKGSFYSTARLTDPFPLQVNARTPIRAHTEQPITTESPGYVTAMIIGDVYTSDKSCVAFPHGSRLMGETNTQVREGQARVLTVWTGIQRPEPRNDTIELTKVVGGEADGTPGIPGEVNEHWFRKFGAIIASSAIDIGTAYLGGRRGNGNQVVIGGTVADNARSPLDDFARRQLDIPPSIEVEPTEVSVTLSQHLAVDCFYKR